MKIFLITLTVLFLMFFSKQEEITCTKNMTLGLDISKLTGKYSVTKNQLKLEILGIPQPTPGMDIKMEIDKIGVITKEDYNQSVKVLIYKAKEKGNFIDYVKLQEVPVDNFKANTAKWVKFPTTFEMVTQEKYLVGIFNPNNEVFPFSYNPSSTSGIKILTKTVSSIPTEVNITNYFPFEENKELGIGICSDDAKAKLDMVCQKPNSTIISLCPNINYPISPIFNFLNSSQIKQYTSQIEEIEGMVSQYVGILTKSVCFGKLRAVACGSVFRQCTKMDVTVEPGSDKVPTLDIAKLGYPPCISMCSTMIDTCLGFLKPIPLLNNIIDLIKTTACKEHEIKINFGGVQQKIKIFSKSANCTTYSSSSMVSVSFVSLFMISFVYLFFF